MSQLARYLGVGWRELWDARDINGSLWLPRASGGHKLTLNNGAARKTTADGVNTGNSAANGGINLGALYNSATTVWFFCRFNLPVAHTAASASSFLFSKDGASYLIVYFITGTGKLRATLVDGITRFDINTVESSFAAGEHTVLLSLSAVNGVRLIVDNGTPVTDVSTWGLPAANNLIFGSAPGEPVCNNFVFKSIIIGTDNLTSAEEADLYKGIPPADAVNLYNCDEGEGLTLNDLGSGGNNGTLGSAVRWQFGGTKKSVLSLDGINSYGQSDAGVNIAGAQSLVVVTKAKNTLDTALAASTLALLRVDANNYLQIAHANGADGVVATAVGSGTSQTASHTTKPAIGDYRIYVMTLTVAGVLTLYVNGTQAATASGVGAVSGGSAIGYIGSNSTPANYGNDAVLLSGLVNGALTGQQVLQLSRRINSEYGLGLSI